MTEPVTLGNLLVQESMGFGSHKKWSTRPATVADLVSALRAEGVLVVERADGGWPEWSTNNSWWSPQMLDRLAEAQR